MPRRTGRLSSVIAAHRAAGRPLGKIHGTRMRSLTSYVVSTLLLGASLVAPLVIGSVTTPAAAATTPWTCSAYGYRNSIPIDYTAA
jgi:hypothetical protein